MNGASDHPSEAAQFPPAPRELVRRRGVPGWLRCVLALLIAVIFNIWVLRRQGASISSLVLFAVLVDLFCGPLLLGWCIEPLLDRRLLRDGSVAEGRITDVKETYTRGATSYTVSYEFTSADHQTVKNVISVDKSEFKSARVGDYLLVIYDSRRPRSRSVPYQYADYSVSTKE